MDSYKNVIYFLNGSIGDFLMVHFLLENIHACHPHLRCIIATPRNAGLFSEFARPYPYLSVIRVDRSTSSRFVAAHFFQKNYCITAPTPGKLPLATKIIARLAALFGTLAGFDDGAPINRYLYTKTIPFTFDKLYFESMLDMVRALGCGVQKERPRLSYSPSPEVLERFGLAGMSYVLLHPFGSNQNRSILGEELAGIIGSIRAATPPGMRIVVSGSAEDAAKIPDSIKNDIIDITGRASLTEVASVALSATLFIGVDTGITHLANVLGVRSLVIAHNGTPHWLPYYNPAATIVYAVKDDTSQVHEGREHLEAKRQGRVQYLDRVPDAVVRSYVQALLAPNAETSA